MKRPVPPLVDICTDAHGTTYTIAAEESVKTPGGQWRLELPAIEVWWSRDGAKADETIIIRQEHTSRGAADIVELTLGQVYGLIDALNRAVESK